ncbi:bifunctional UDP-sugar hydrolase/5'-nucleotidase [Egicoccus sp. AB-alg2]|uniref:bifunctional metallophosphatase/5'-nucleotidase n=1 Tax=Egicoccus sp. AB-alg2 TaxID=3242693 RepID=UPI00359DD866
MSTHTSTGLCPEPGAGGIRRGSRATLLLVLLLSLTLATSGLAQAKPAGTPGHDAKTFELTIMGTTDIHGHVWDWDYFADAPFSSARGLAHLSTLVNEVRAERGAERTLLLDNGDFLQGNQLAYYYAEVERDTGMTDNPIAAAMNHMGFDATSVGNHEFNYGLDFLDGFIEQADFPLLSANTYHHGTQDPAYEPYTIRRVNVPGHKPVDVGIIGFTPPGVAIWDQRHVEGVLEFGDIVESAKRFVPELARKTDLVVAVAHSGLTSRSSYGPELPLENAATELAQEVAGLDAILVGHTHVSIPERFIANDVTGEQVLVTQPQQHGRQLSVMDFTLRLERGQWTVAHKGSHVRNATSVAPDPAILDLTREAHETTVAYVNTPIGTSTGEWSSRESVYRDTPIMDLIHTAQIGEVEARLEALGGPDLPVLSIAAPFTRDAFIPAGQVTIRNVASAYIYDNTLLAVELTGAQIADFLEYSAKYFQTPSSWPVDPETILQANNEPHYNYDIIGGLTYDVDVAKPVGERIQNLQFEGAPLDPEQRFAVAINNYRQSGGGGFPHVTTAPVLLDEQREVRQLIIDYVSDVGVIDPEEIFEDSWRLVHDGTPLD